MNKVLNIIKYVLFILSIFLILYFIKEYDLTGKNIEIKFELTFIITMSLLSIVFILNIIDIIIIKKVNKLKGYNVLTIIDLLTLVFIFYRTLFDKSIVSNQLRHVYLGYFNRYGYRYCMFYCIIINILLILNITYFIINVKKFNKKKH